MSTAYAIIYLVTVVFNSILGLTIWLKNPKQRINQSFALYIIGVVGWIITLFLLYSFKEATPFLLTVGRLNFFFAVFLIYFQFLLTYYFPKVNFNLNRYLHALIILETIILGFVTLLTPLIDKNELIVDGSLVTEYGSLYSWFTLHFVGLLVASLFVLLYKFWKFRGVERNQLKILFLGFFATGLFSITTNLIVPLFTGYYDIQKIGVVATVFMVSATAYAIVRHKFLDIPLIIARAVSHSLLVIFVLVTYTSLVFTFSNFIPEGVNPIYVSIASSLIVVFSFNPIRSLLEKATDKIFFKGRYDTEELLSELTQIMASEIDIAELGIKLLNILKTQMRLTKGAFVLVKEGEVQNMSQIGFSEEALKSEQLLSLLIDEQESYIFEELTSENQKNLFRELDISVIWELKVKDEIIGFLVLGPKASGDIYSSQDSELLGIFAPQVAIALQNAESYRQIQEFSRTLERKVQERTKELKKTQASELAKAKQLLKLKDEFVFIATHDLGTPVTAIKGFVHLLEQKEKKLSKDSKENLAALGEASERLSTLTNDLLQVARSESDAIKVETKEVDIISSIKSTLKQVGPQAKANKINLNSEFHAKKCIVLADGEKLSEVMENLLSNAIKYNKEKGEVTVTTRVNKNALQVDVKDTGIGIPKDHQDKIFQKFVRVQQAGTENISGTGLGLFVVRMLIEKMKGKISFRSEEGKGTTFSFILPLADSQALKETGN